jgi:hypothetical protein
MELIYDQLRILKEQNQFSLELVSTELTSDPFTALFSFKNAAMATFLLLSDSAYSRTARRKEGWAI